MRERAAAPQPVLKRAHGRHEPHCPIGGYRGEDRCRHAANCRCEGGETMDEAAVAAKVRALEAEARFWSLKLAAPRRAPWFRR